MLRIIRQLSKELAEKIAAGEVVERPLSIVKELTENAIDAGSDTITVEIRKGGKEYIRVTDNGCGIDKDQVRLAFSRYATSKISTEEDLSKIGTLGFRGEALASIAIVSRVQLITKTEDSKLGTKIRIEGGTETEFSDAASEDGTTIIVEDLFYNTPARFKFLKADNAESTLITEYVSKMALAYPGVKFRLINNGTILFSTPGKGSLYDTILTVYSPKTAQTLVKVYYEDNGMKLQGYVSGPEGSRTNKRAQIFFVNGRWIKSRLMDNAVEAAFSDKLFEGRYPVCYLFLELDPEDIDVNVHPAKTEIKFLKEEECRDFIIKGIRTSMLQQTAAPNLANLTSDKNVSSEIGKVTYAPAPEQPAVIMDGQKSIENESVYRNNFQSTGSEVNERIEEVEDLPVTDFFSKLRRETTEIQQEIPQVKEQFEQPERFKFTSIQPIGQIFTTYILAADQKNFYIIDQHAAHERIMYEKLLSAYENRQPSSQLLLTPLVIHADAVQKAAEASWMPVLTDLGFAFEEFGPMDFKVSAIPSSLKFDEAEDFIYKVLESNFDNPTDFNAKRNAIISAACKSAVKAGDKLSDLEILKLFEELDACRSPFSCPHGRPTFLRFSEGEIEHFFKRK